MAKKAARPRRLYIPVVPAGASWIESDSYDRRAWSDIGLGAPAIGEPGRGRPPPRAAFRCVARRSFFRAVQVQPGLAQDRRCAQKRDPQSHHPRSPRRLARLRSAQKPHAARRGQGRDSRARACRTGARARALRAAAQPPRTARPLGSASSGRGPGRARRRIEGDGGGGRAGRRRAPPDQELKKKSRSSKRRRRAPFRSPRLGSTRKRGR